MHFPLPAVKTLLCIGAHADDIEIGCGGFVMRLLTEQPIVQVHWCVFSGDSGRHAEALSSAQRILAPIKEKAVDLFDFRDGFFPAEMRAIKEQFIEVRQRCSPDLILTHQRNDAHQDHSTLAELTHQTFRDAQILEYEIPKYDGDLGQPNFYVSLDEGTAKRKVDLLTSEFASQHEKRWYSADTFRSLLTIRGIECQSTTGFAEAFYARKLTF